MRSQLLSLWQYLKRVSLPHVPLLRKNGGEKLLKNQAHVAVAAPGMPLWLSQLSGLEALARRLRMLPNRVSALLSLFLSARYKTRHCRTDATQAFACLRLCMHARTHRLVGSRPWCAHSAGRCVLRLLVFPRMGSSVLWFGVYGSWAAIFVR